MSKARSKRNQKGIPFNLMIVGQAGLGKTTFIRTLVGKTMTSPREDEENDLSEKTIELNVLTEDIEEEGQKIVLSVVDTPGFGDNVDNSKSFKRILEYVEIQYKRYLAEESKVPRNIKFQDTRVHIIIYFIPPTGHSLRDLDILFMKQLGRRCNIIPVIARADSLLPSEMKEFKQRIMEDIKRNDIPIFDFPSNNEDDEEIIQENEEFRASLPFSIIGSDRNYEVKGKQVPGRKYPWGVVEVLNEQYSDFVKMKTVLFATHFEVFREMTDEKHYENFRQEYLSNTNSKGVDGEKLEEELQALEKSEKERKERDKEEKEKRKKASKAEKAEKSSEKSEKKKDDEDGEKKKKKKDKDKEKDKDEKKKKGDDDTKEEE